jgi:AcrR family transcriptional regulator
MREIAKRIEYSATALYKHFADKDALVRELCNEDFTAFARYFLEQVAASGDPVKRFAHAGLAYLEFAEQYPEQYRLMFMTELPPTPPEEGERDDPARNAYVFLRGLIDELMRGGYLRAELTDVDLVAQTVWAGVHGAAALDLVVPKSKDWLDFRARSERFACALEMVARSIAKDPDEFARVLRRTIERTEKDRTTAAKKGAS